MPQQKQNYSQSSGSSEPPSWILRHKYSPTIYYRMDGPRNSANRVLMDREALFNDLKQTKLPNMKLPGDPAANSTTSAYSSSTQKVGPGNAKSDSGSHSTYPTFKNRAHSRRCLSPEPQVQEEGSFKGAKAGTRRFASPQRRKSTTDLQNFPKNFPRGRTLNRSTRSTLLGGSALATFVSPASSPDLQSKEMRHLSSWSKLVHHSGGSMRAVETAKDWMVDLSKLFVGTRFASGAHSRLYHGLYDEKPVAVKIILQPEEDQDDDMAMRLERQFDREVTILSHLYHPNIVQLIAACRNPPVFCIITEYLSGGSLRSYLHKREPGPVNLDECISISLYIARGMEYLHSQGIIHRDLKSENLLFSADKCLKIVDFGIASEEMNVDCLEEDRGTYRWMAPEAINHKPHNRKVDVYSFGIVLWEIITGKIPYEDMTPVQAAFAVVHKNARPTIPENCPVCVQKLMENCWAQNPDKRPESWEIVKILEQFLSAIRTHGSLDQCQHLCIGEKRHGVHKWKKFGGRMSGTAAISPSPHKVD